jgi:hypothetical protein
MIKRKVKEWLKRYLPAEIVGTVTAVSSASIAHLFSANLLLTAYAGSFGEAIGFYSTVFIQNILQVHKKNKIEEKTFSLANITGIITTIVLEFGPAGLIDGLLLRPLFMFLFPVLFKNFTLGILIGKFTGDLTFYMLVILSYEIQKKKR